MSLIRLTVVILLVIVISAVAASLVKAEEVEKKPEYIFKLLGVMPHPKSPEKNRKAISDLMIASYEIIDISRETVRESIFDMKYTIERGLTKMGIIHDVKLRQREHGGMTLIEFMVQYLDVDLDPEKNFKRRPYYIMMTFATNKKEGEGIY